MQVDLHQLANKPGFGSAKKELAEAGLWQEIDEETGFPVWRVDVEISVTRTEEDTVIVAAPDEATAKRLAKKADFDVCGDDIEVMVTRVLLGKPGDQVTERP